MPARHDQPGDRHDPVRDLNSRARWIVPVVAIALVLWRSAIFLFWDQSFFDSDQAITGLMARHLSEGRAFPVFYYGQNYMLAVEAWLAAPLFFLSWPPVLTIKLPLLVINIAVVLLLLRTLEREAGLRQVVALVPVLFFALPAVNTSAHLVAANGGNVEPFLYVLLLWLTRRRPGWCGVIFALGFLQREFVLYGLAALVSIEVISRSIFSREGVRRTLIFLHAAATTWLFGQWLKQFSSAGGPGTSIADLHVTRSNVTELASRLCFDMAALPAGAWRLVTEHWPLLFGMDVHPLVNFGIESTVHQGLTGSAVLLLATVLVAAAGIARHVMPGRRDDQAAAPRANVAFCQYLVLVGLFSAAGYVAGRCGELHYFVMRYEMLSILGMVGLGGWFLAREQSGAMRRAWVLIACATIGVAALGHGRMWTEYLRRPPTGAKQLVIRHLEAQGVRYATADYWIAYYITYLTSERIIVASDGISRVLEYERIVEAHRDESVRISRTACEGGRQVVEGVYFCRP